jgi:phosphoesterase RecJ-like protein
VNTFARKYFDGGGHYNAAGGQSRAPFDEVVATFIKVLSENKEELCTYQF